MTVYTVYAVGCAMSKRMQTPVRSVNQMAEGTMCLLDVKGMHECVKTNRMKGKTVAVAGMNAGRMEGQ